MTRVIIHPGFHKTGTTSLQRVLEINEALIAQYALVILKPQMEDVAKRARDCSNVAYLHGLLRRPFVRAAFRRQFAALLHRTPLKPGQVLLISCEALVGRMPGRDGVKAFDAAVGLALDMVSVADKHFGNDLDLTFLYTTRSAKSWMQSAYSHLLHQSKFTMTEEEFQRKFIRAGDQESILTQIRRAVAPHRVINSNLKLSAAEPLGPAGALLEMLELPADVTDQIVLPRQLNKKLTPFELDRLKNINARDLNDAELEITKRKFLRKQRKRAGRQYKPD